MKRKLHIVSFDIPYPADYGGVIDVFSKLKRLHQAGVSITLHCFEYGRPHAPELNKYCDTVFYYPRKKAVSLLLPYIVVSRRDRLLKKRLLSADGPVLLEGIHATYELYAGNLKSENVWVRLHNVEHKYYYQLFTSSRKLFNKIYYLFESMLLRRYEKKLAPGNRFLALSVADAGYFRSLKAQRVTHLPLFTDYEGVRSLPGKGAYCLYHGNLSVAENEDAVVFLISEVFSKLDIPFKVCGKDPSSRIEKLCYQQNVELIKNPGNLQLDALIRDAHIHILPSFNNTGMKVKILHALSRGRFVITNENAVRDEKWASLCIIADNSASVIASVTTLMSASFDEKEIAVRARLMGELFNPENNTKQLIQLLFS